MSEKKSNKRKTVVDYPELVKQWNDEKNHGSRPDEYSYGSNRKVWWRCEKGHEWEAIIGNRTKGRGCPYCSGRKALAGDNDLLKLYPDIAREWNSKKNGSLLPSQIRPGSNEKVWWICRNGHEWEASPDHRINGRGGPYCSHHKVMPENSLSQLFPNLLDEWD